ncbi:hypothetical protein P4O66_003271 [Electrophorus voltai]|uniref:Reverse transcriptase domain-containing protein n=1 Tax=Electrophorus voltai TaxID=2609070 RepID=A0AAD8YPV5_9TELE|nr:hypothetical protein P4O66_003271 [Electrophorus voltai]
MEGERQRLGEKGFLARGELTEDLHLLFDTTVEQHGRPARIYTNKEMSFIMDSRRRWRRRNKRNPAEPSSLGDAVPPVPSEPDSSQLTLKKDKEPVYLRYKQDKEPVSLRHKQDKEPVSLRHKQDKEPVSLRHKQEKEPVSLRHKEDKEPVSLRHKQDKEPVSLRHKQDKEPVSLRHKQDKEPVSLRHKQDKEPVSLRHKQEKEPVSLRHKQDKEPVSLRHKQDKEPVSLRHKQEKEPVSLRHKQDKEPVSLRHKQDKEEENVDFPFKVSVCQESETGKKEGYCYVKLLMTHSEKCHISCAPGDAVSCNDQQVEMKKRTTGCRHTVARQGMLSLGLNSSAFNTIIPSLLTTKLEDLGLHPSLGDWISNFLTDRPQSVRVGNCASSTLTLSTGAPQGCVLSPLLYSLYTYDCVATSSSTITVMFTDDTVAMGLISDNNERAYLEEIKHLENWCQENHLLLNISKTKELIVDCSKKQEWHYQPVRINGTTVERVDSFRYLGVHISQDLCWSHHTNSLAKKAHQCLYCLRDFRLPSKVLWNFYTCTIESILMGKITVWFGNCIKEDRQGLHSVVRSAVRITHMELPDLQTIYHKQCQTKARRIVKDPTHPNNRLFSLLRYVFCHFMNMSETSWVLGICDLQVLGQTDS